MNLLRIGTRRAGVNWYHSTTIGRPRIIFLKLPLRIFTNAQMAIVARELTPVLSGVLGLVARKSYKANVKCISYDPATMAIGDRLLSDVHSDWASEAP